MTNATLQSSEKVMALLGRVLVQLNTHKENGT